MWKAIDYEEKYLDQMIEMIKENYGDVEIANKEFLQWQYFDNPAGKAVIKFAYDEENDQLAGMYVLAPCDIKVGGKIVKCCNDIDTITRPNYRKQGIFIGLAQEIYKKCEAESLKFIIQLPNENSIHGYRKYFNPPIVEKFPVVIKPINCERAITKKTNRILGNMLSFADVFFISKKAISNKEAGYAIEELTYENVFLFDEFWQSVKSKYNIAMARSSKYIKWRYLDVPLRKYKTFLLIKEGKLKGYISSIPKRIMGLDAGIIVDYMISEDNSFNESRMLIKYTMEHFEKENLDVAMGFISKNTREYELLGKERFLKIPSKLLPREFTVFCQITNHKEQDIKDYICDEKNWFSVIGDHLLV